LVLALEIQRSGSPRRLDDCDALTAPAVGLLGQRFGTQKQDGAREVVYGGRNNERTLTQGGWVRPLAYDPFRRSFYDATGLADFS
jgi:hypothetical protein